MTEIQDKTKRKLQARGRGKQMTRRWRGLCRYVSRGRPGWWWGVFWSRCILQACARRSPPFSSACTCSVNECIIASCASSLDDCCSMNMSANCVLFPPAVADLTDHSARVPCSFLLHVRVRVRVRVFACVYVSFHQREMNSMRPRPRRRAVGEAVRAGLFPNPYRQCVRAMVFFPCEKIFITRTQTTSHVAVLLLTLFVLRCICARACVYT